jgi:hypothetical protein
MLIGCAHPDLGSLLVVLMALDALCIGKFILFPLQGAFAVKFGTNARALYVGSGDHNLRVYGAPASAS